MTDTIPSEFTDVFQPTDATPDYDSFHEIFDELTASNELADHIDTFGKTEIDYVGDWSETPDGAYPTVTQIDNDLDARQEAPAE